MLLDSVRSVHYNTASGSPITPPLFALSVRPRVRAHSVAVHTSMHSIFLYLGLTLVKSHFCNYQTVVTAYLLKIRRSSGSQFLQMF